MRWGQTAGLTVCIAVGTLLAIEVLEHLQTSPPPRGGVYGGQTVQREQQRRTRTSVLHFYHNSANSSGAAEGGVGSVVFRWKLPVDCFLFRVAPGSEAPRCGSLVEFVLSRSTSF